MPPTIEIEDQLEIIRAFGLGGDPRVVTNKRRKKEKTKWMSDPWGELVFVCRYDVGFVTELKYLRNLTSGPQFRCPAAEDYLRSAPSKVVCDDADEIVYTSEWLEQISGSQILRWKRFIAVGATFAATERFGVPERVFLFPASPHFELEVVIAQLELHRREHDYNVLGDIAAVGEWLQASDA